MGKIGSLIESAKKDPKNIVLPELDDERVVQAAQFIKKEGIARLVSTEEADKERLSQGFYEIMKNKGLTLDEARKTVEDPLYTAAMMVRVGEADSFVAGASHTTRDVIRAAMKCLGMDRARGVIFGAFLVEIEGCPYGDNGFFIFADCAVIPLPNSKQLARIAVSSAKLLKGLFQITPSVAFLTYSSSGSADGESIDRVREAVGNLKVKNPDLLVDGELQLDAAIIPEIQKRKSPNSPLKGKANILIFPSLDAGNITYKAVERFGKARAVGPTLIGLKKPCSDLSRGCSVDDIVETVALTAARVDLTGEKNKR